MLKTSVEDPYAFCPDPDPDPTFQIIWVRIQIRTLAHINYVQTFPNLKFLIQKWPLNLFKEWKLTYMYF
jgi:hypothetical protein